MRASVTADARFGLVRQNPELRGRQFGRGEAVSPASRASAGCPGVLRPRRPGLTFLPLLADRRSPPERTLPPPVDDELVRQECDGTEASAARKSGCAPKFPRIGRQALRSGRTTRSSRWTTSCGSPSGSSDVWRPATPRSTRRGVPDQPFGERHAGAVDDLDRVVGLERALDPAHAGRQQRAVVRTQRPAGAVVDHDPARRRPGRRRSTACGSTGARRRGSTTVPTARPATASRDDVGRVGGRDHRPHARPRRDLGRGQLAWPCRRSPGRCRCRRRAPRARRRPRRSPR